MFHGGHFWGASVRSRCLFLWLLVCQVDIRLLVLWLLEVILILIIFVTVVVAVVVLSGDRSVDGPGGPSASPELSLPRSFDRSFTRPRQESNPEPAG